MTDKVTSIRRPETLEEVGGPVDEFRITLAVYGEDLDPPAVSQRLGCQPTAAHRKGDRRKAGSRPYPIGAWLLTVEGKAPASPSAGIESLLQQFPNNEEFWKELTNRYDVQLRIGIQTEGWNRGFHISAKAAGMIATTGARIEFDLYFHGDDDHV